MVKCWMHSNIKGCYSILSLLNSDLYTILFGFSLCHWIGLREHLQVWNGFRLRFSLKPIHWLWDDHVPPQQKPAVTWPWWCPEARTAPLEAWHEVFIWYLPSENIGWLSHIKDHRSHLYKLVGGLEHGFYFSIQLGIIIPTDELHHFSEG